MLCHQTEKTINACIDKSVFNPKINILSSSKFKTPTYSYIYYFIGLAFWIASVLKLFYVADPVLTKAILNVCSGQGSAGLDVRGQGDLSL